MLGLSVGGGSAADDPQPVLALAPTPTPAPAVDPVHSCEAELSSSSWSAGKPVGGPEMYEANPWRFDSNNRFVTERDGCNGRWHVRADSSAPGGVLLRMDWEVSEIVIVVVLRARANGTRKRCE